MTAELEPCPFCGAACDVFGQFDEYAWVGCGCCGYDSGETRLGMSKAVAAHNTMCQKFKLHKRLLHVCEGFVRLVEEEGFQQLATGWLYQQAKEAVRQAEDRADG